MTEGVYLGLSEFEYRTDEAISQSLLKEFGEAATPLHFLKRKPKVATADMEFGTVVHAAILQPDQLHLAYHLRPETYPSTPKPTKANPNPTTEQKKWTGNSDWCKEWLADHSDRPVMTQEQLNKLPKIRERVLKLPEFGSALEHGQTEVAHFKHDEETGLMLKCRVDLEATDANESTWIFDLKKVQSGCATAEEFTKQAYNLGYDIQAASYLAVTGASHFVFVVFDDDEPFDAIQWRPDREFLQHGHERWRGLLRRYAECVKSGTWPGYSPGLNVLMLPEFVKRRL